MEFRLDDIEHADIVLSHFGYWPSFHDAEVISMNFVRDNEKGHASMHMKILAFEMTDKLKDGSFQLVEYCLIDIEFFDLEKSEINGFNHQNVLEGLQFGKRDNVMFCKLNTSYGVDGYIEAKKIRINKLTLGMSPKS